MLDPTIPVMHLNSIFVFVKAFVPDKCPCVLKSMSPFCTAANSSDDNPDDKLWVILSVLKLLEAEELHQEASKAASTCDLIT